MASSTVALLIDDDPISRKFLRRILEPVGYSIIECEDGEEGWEALRANTSVGFVLLDHYMPRLDGLRLLQRIKEHPDTRHIPVCMITSRDDPEFVAGCLKAGVFYLLAKPFKPPIVISVIEAALDQYRAHKEMAARSGSFQNALGRLDACRLNFRTPDEAKDVAMALASVCPEAPMLAFGLQELLINAVEHGNLGITHLEKKALIQEGALLSTIAHRLEEEPYRQRRVRVSLEKDEREARFTIVDDGEGFDWLPYVDRELSRFDGTHGRGIVMARTVSFATVEYRGRGNEVLAVVDLSGDDDGAPTS